LELKSVSEDRSLMIIYDGYIIQIILSIWKTEIVFHVRIILTNLI
jgi:hypothetical protein